MSEIADAGAWFGSLAERWSDRGTSTNRPMPAVLGGLADVESDLIRTAHGRHMGCPPLAAAGGGSPAPC